MPEILTESFCERCGTRYTFESAAPRSARLKGLKVMSRGLKNFVMSDDTSMDEAMAAARSDTDREVTSHQLDAFHKTFNFCMTCRQYTCGNCWNDAEGRCLSCAPHLGQEILPAPFPGLDAHGGFATSNGANGTNGHEPAESDLAELPNPDAMSWPTSDFMREDEVAAAELEPPEAVDAGLDADAADDLEPIDVLARLGAAEAAEPPFVEVEGEGQPAAPEAVAAAEADAIAASTSEAVSTPEAEIAAAEAITADADPAVIGPAQIDPDDVDGRAIAAAAQTSMLLRSFRPGQNLDAEIAAFESELEVEVEPVARQEDLAAAAALGAAAMAGAEAEPVAPRGPEPVAESEPVAEPVAAAEPVEPEPVAVAEPVEPEPVVAEPVAEPVAVAEPVEPELVAEPEPVAVAEPAAAVEPVAEPVAAAEPVAEPIAAEPEPVAEPDDRAAAMLLAAAAAKATSDSVVVEDHPAPVAAVESGPELPPEPVAAVEAETVVAAEPEPVPSPDQQPEPEPEPVAAAPAPEPVAAAEPGFDIVAQPTWQIMAPDAPTTDGVLPPSSPAQPGGPAEPVAATAEPEWPAQPQWPSGRPTAAGLPFFNRPAAPSGGMEALWAESAREVATAAPDPAARASGGVQPCVSCGLSLSATARFCRRCGTAQV